MNLPNKLTVSRCLMAIVFVAFMSFENVATYLLGLVTFIVAAITDYYDGKIARERNLITNFGKLLDPVADKVLMVSAFIMLMQVPELHIPGWTIVVILAREFLVTGARSLAAAEGSVIPASVYGKRKTAFQMTFVITFLSLVVALRLAALAPQASALLPGGLAMYRDALAPLSLVAIVLIAIYTLYSGAQFAWQNWKALRLDTAV